MSEQATSKTFTDPRDILLKPVVSEKSYALLDENKYTFIVDPRANKTQIKQAVEAVFSTGRASASAPAPVTASAPTPSAPS